MTENRSAPSRSHVRAVHLILFVRDQAASAAFYSRALALEPRRHVPGMTEFALRNGTVLGLMPQEGVERLHGGKLPGLAETAGTTRAELYLVVDDAKGLHERALAAGARELSGLQERSWGDRVAYSLDPDGHMLAFAER